jgi:hypothetical protein
MGCPGWCCFKKKRKRKGSNFATTRYKIPTPIRRGTPSDWEFARGTHSRRKSQEKGSLHGIVEIPNQIPMKTTQEEQRQEQRLKWGPVNPMHSPETGI